jgi:hypothetical protein
MSKTWTNAEINKLKTLWERNALSAAGIAAALNDQFATDRTHNAIIGKANHLGLAPRRKPRKLVTSLYTKPVLAPEDLNTPQESLEYTEAVDIQGFTDESLPNVTKPNTGRKSIFELCERDCRWIDGQDYAPNEKIYCGAETVAIGAAYCKFHVQIAYIPSTSRKKPPPHSVENTKNHRRYAAS